MRIQKSVRQRRQEKIRRLNEESRRVGRHDSLKADPSFHTEEMYPQGFHHRTAGERMSSAGAGYPPAAGGEAPDNDPERAWKERQASWLQEEGGGWPYRMPPLRQARGRGDVGSFREGSGWSEYGNSGGPLLRELRVKLLAAIALFGGVWGLFQAQGEWAAEGQSFVTQALTQNMDFEAAAVWYRETFAGAPTFIPIFGGSGSKAQSVGGAVKQPVTSPLAGGTVVRTFAELLNGVELAGKPQEDVGAAQEGRVTLVSGDSESGYTVVIQHAGGRTTIYGKMSAAEVSKGDWVQPGQTIGELGPQLGTSGTALLYFAVKQNDSYVDPADVVPID